MSVSEDNKTIAKMGLEAFGGQPQVVAYWDDNNESSIDILECINRPWDGITSYSTIGLSDHSIGYKVEDKPLGVEIVGACLSTFECFPNIIGTCAFNIINSSFTCYPGAIFPRVVELYIPDSDMEHVMFVPPFLWEDKLKMLDFPSKKVTWLLAVPISQAELEYAEQNGTDALEKLLEQHQVNFYDLMRRTIA